MTSNDLIPLAKQYLRDLKLAARCLPRDRRTELISEIEGHLRESIHPEATDIEVQQILERLGTPQQIVAADLPAPAPTNAAGYGREVGAIILLLVGGFIFGIGWFIGLFLLWTSNLWTLGDKLIGTFILPGGLVGSVFIVLLAGGGSGSCYASSNASYCTSSGDLGFVRILAAVLSLLLPVFAAIYLGLRARSARQIHRMTALATAI